MFAVLLAPFSVYDMAEAGILDRIVPECENCGFCNLIELAQNILNFLVSFAVIAAVLMFVYAGFLYMTAGGSEDKIKKAHKIFKNVFIGFLFVLASFLIVDTVMKAFLKEDSKFGFWNEIGCGSSGSLPVEKIWI